MPRVASPADEPPAPDLGRLGAIRRHAPAAMLIVVASLTVFVSWTQNSAMNTSGVCQGGTVAGVRAELLFGRNTGQSLAVTGDQFQGFLDREVTPRFPGGFTVYDASGHWQDHHAASISREPSYALMIVLREASRAHDGLAAIAQAYKRQFNQQSVLVSVSPTCFAM
jgi:hypothetical protein